MFKGLSSATFKKSLDQYFKKYSEQQSERDELNSILRLDSTCSLFVKNIVFTDSFQSGTIHLQTATSMLGKKVFANWFGL